MTVLTSNKEVEEFGKNPPEDIDDNLYLITDINDKVYVVNGGNDIPQTAVGAVRAKAGDNEEKLRIKSIFSSKFGKQDPEVFNQKVHDEAPESKTVGDGSVYDAVKNKAIDAVNGPSEEEKMQKKADKESAKAQKKADKAAAKEKQKADRAIYNESAVISIEDILKL